MEQKSLSNNAGQVKVAEEATPNFGLGDMHRAIRCPIQYIGLQIPICGES